MSVLMIWVLTGVLVYAAVLRVVSMDFEVDADIMIIVAAVGVVMNIVLGLVLHGPGGHGHSHGLGGHSHGSDNHSEDSHNHNDHSHNGPEQQQTIVTVDGVASGDMDSHHHSHEEAPGKNINVRAAFVHVIGDLLQSIGVLIASYIIRYYPEYKIADPICTFIFSVLVVITTGPIIRDVYRVLMEGEFV